MRKILLTAFIAFLVLPGLTASKKYVSDTNGDDNDNGNNWNTPYKTLTKALTEVSSGDEIFIEAGTYYPDVSERDSSFGIPAGVSVLGGYAVGTHDRIDYGDGEANQTILSGDIGTSGSSGDNSHQIVKIIVGASATTTLDGLIIANGNGTGYSINGVGIYFPMDEHLNINNCVVKNCIGGVNGGGFYIDRGQVLMDNVNIKNCEADYGGGIYFNNLGSQKPRFNLSIIESNTASINGGGIYLKGDAFLEYSQITNNTATNSGGGIYIDNTTQTWIKASLIANNSSIYGGGIYNYKGNDTDINNSIIVNNETSSNGAGIYFDEASYSTIANNTIVNNKANSTNGFGIYLKNTSNKITVINTIFSGESSFAQIYVDANSSLTLGYSYVKGGASGIDILGSITYTDGSFGATCVSASPLDFINPTTTEGLNPSSPAYNTANWAIDDLSVCKDAGTPNGTTGDTPPYIDGLIINSGTLAVQSSELTASCQNGLSRVNGTIDIGAFENGGIITEIETTSPSSTIKVYIVNKVVYVTSPSVGEVNIYNVSGQLLSSTSITKGTSPVYNANRASIYLITFSNATQSESIKISVQ